MCAAELSYVQLKAANEARESEEQRFEQRRKNLLVLIRHYLLEEGFLDSAQALVREAGSSLTHWAVCDNIDLPAILQEYESYYFVKFKKNPKVTKKVAVPNDTLHNVNKSKPPHNKSSRGSDALSLPHIPSERRGEGRSLVGRRPNSDGKKKRKAFTSTDTFMQSSSTHSTPPPSHTGSVGDLGLTGSAIKEEKKSNRKPGMVTNVHGIIRDVISNATSQIDTMDPQDRLLKPLAGFTGYNTELRDLAAVISRDIYSQDPNVHWGDIVGLDNAKRLVKEAVVYPIKYPQLFTGLLSPWKGLLLYGPPGTGKTMLAKAVATECKTTFFNISASSIVSKWRGDSEKLVRVLFELARFHAPSTIFMDELESIMGQRAGFGSAGGEHEGSRRMKTELLVQMDGLAKSSDLVFVLAASNLPWELDHAMLRRLEKRILVDLPTESARCAMFQHHLPPSLSPPPLSISCDVDYSRAAQLTEGYSGSDIRLVCKEATMHTVRQVFDKLETLEDSVGSVDSISFEPVRTHHVEAAIARTKPSARQLANKYLEWQKEYESV